MAILGQDALSMQVTDGCQGRLPGFWFVQWGMWYLLRREGILENQWVWGQQPDISRFCPIFQVVRKAEGSFWPEMGHCDCGLCFTPCVASRGRGKQDPEPQSCPKKLFLSSA